MYQVLYRKYRPKVFSDVVGQPQVTEVLAGEVSAGRLSHAYLFTGTRGTGKTTCARIFAKAVCCLNPKNGDPCGECAICRGIDDGSVMDYSELDAAGNRSIEDIRRIKEEAITAPQTAKYRIFVLDEVHMLTNEAFNALLKILEEPPEHVIFILATTDVQKLPSTVLSRCQRFDFTRIDSDIICKRLIEIAEKEGKKLTYDGAALIAGMADGAMRDSLSILDRCMSEDGDIDSSVVSAVSGLMGRDALFRLSDAITDGNTSEALKTVDDFHRASCDSERLCSDLAEHFRGYMIAKTVKRPEDILVCTAQDIERFKERAAKIPIDKILYYIDILSETVDKLKKSSNGRVDAEMAVIKLCSPALSDSHNALLARIAQLENELVSLRKNGIPEKEENVSNKTVSESTEASDTPIRTSAPENVQNGFDKGKSAYNDNKTEQKQTPYEEKNVDLPPFDTESDDTDLPPFDTEDDDEPIPLPFDSDTGDVPNNPPFGGDDDAPFDSPFDEEADSSSFPPFDEDDEPMPFDSAPPPFGENDGIGGMPFDSVPIPEDDGPFGNDIPVFSESKSINSEKVSLNGDSFRQWRAICDEAKIISPPLNGLLDGSSAVENGDTLVLSSVNPLFSAIVAKNEHMIEVIKKSAEKVTGRKFKLKFI